jgi:hypothetical protein
MSLVFWKAAAERAVKTFAQTVLALLGTGSVGITSLDWGVIASVAATATLASVLTSLASLSTVVPLAPVTVAEPTVSAPAKAPAASLPIDAAPVVSFAETQAKIDAILPPAVVTPADPNTTA